MTFSSQDRLPSDPGRFTLPRTPSALFRRHESADPGEHGAVTEEPRDRGTQKPSAGFAPVALESTALALAAVQLSLHAAFAIEAKDPRIVVPHLVAWVQDAVLLTLVVLAASLLARAGGETSRRIAAAVGWVVLLALGVFLATYPRMLQSSLAFPVNLFKADTATATVFLREYSGLRVLWPALLALGAAIAGPWLVFLRLPRRKIVVAALLAISVPTLVGQAPNPIVYSVQDEVRESLRAGARAVPRLVPGASGGRASSVEVRSPLEADGTPRYDHIVVVVLEGVTSASFESEFLKILGGFFERNAGRARYFPSYWATNLDSYTSLIAMTTSVMVPFRAYADPARYERVNDLPNAVRALRAKGCRTLFVSTYQVQPFVPNRSDWDRVADRRDLSTVDGWTSLGTSRMESATEDRAALPLILAHVASAPRTLVISELVYGHTPEWRAATGITQLAYYDRYLAEMQDGLRGAGLEERTLIVVVSDHGDRSAASVVDNYRVPLLLVGDGVRPGEDARVFSHLDLQGIIAHYALGTPLPAPRSRIMTVGSTERWVYGEIVPPDQYTFIEDGTGLVLSRGGAVDPADVHRRVQDQIDLVDGIERSHEKVDASPR
jgi:hypothetical protein